MISHTGNIGALLLLAVYVLCNTLVAQLNSQQDTTFANSWGPHRPHRHALVQPYVDVDVIIRFPQIDTDAVVIYYLYLIYIYICIIICEQ